MAKPATLPNSTLARIRAIERGLPFRRLARLGTQLDEPAASIAELVQIAPRTLARRKTHGTLKPDESERVERFERIYAQAVELFEGDRTAAVRWLKQANRGLALRTPLDFSRTEIGAREVERLIGRLEHGVFA